MKVVMIIVPIMLTLGVCSCSEKKQDNWYEDSAIKKSDEKSYIQDQMMMGVSREDARGTYARNVFWEATEGKDQKTVIEAKDINYQDTPSDNSK